jgi:hypothetical protein
LKLIVISSDRQNVDIPKNDLDESAVRAVLAVTKKRIPRASSSQCMMSTLPPESGEGGVLFDQLVGAHKKRQWHGEAERGLTLRGWG